MRSSLPIVTSQLQGPSLLLWLEVILLAGWCCRETSSFSLHSLQQASPPVRERTRLTMGLYDTPLPPRPPPRDDDGDGDQSKGRDMNDQDESQLQLPITQRLFSFDDNGAETQDLLPSLGRRLDLGVECYYETTDRTVQNLADQANCCLEDAAWALEACKGDRTEARTRIGVAQRRKLDATITTTTSPATSQQDNNGNNNNNGPDYLDQVKAELYDLLQEDEFQERKEQRLQEEQKQTRNANLKPSEQDAPWLPIKNPKPIDDEPWFTG